VPDRLLADLSVPAVLRDVVLPYLADLGERWQRETASVAMEHSPAISSAAGSRG
jgi:MerR family transcriptional regulator, light-induced transcriptional regulator